MYGVIFAITVLAVVGLGALGPTTVANDRSKMNEAVSRWETGLNLYRQSNCRSGLSSVTEDDLLSQGFLDNPLHANIQFSATFTGPNTVALSLITPRPGKPSKVLTRAHIETDGERLVIDGVESVRYATGAYTIGENPPGAQVLLTYDRKRKGCLTL